MLTLAPTSLTLFRGNSRQLTATVSSGLKPIWKSNKKSVATVDDNGSVTAIKHGTATITATVDGVSKACTITVGSPKITLSDTEKTLTPGETAILRATVSSGNQPCWHSNNTDIATVDNNGVVTALAPGRASIYATDDGAKARCAIIVKSPGAGKSKKTDSIATSNHTGANK